MHLLFSAAPSGPPTDVRATDITPTTITVQWGLVNCIDRNGEITGYSVRYRVGTTVNSRGTVSDTVATIEGLKPSTRYTIEVAAVNDIDTGPYSTGIEAETDGEYESVIVPIWVVLNLDRISPLLEQWYFKLHVHTCILHLTVLTHG